MQIEIFLYIYGAICASMIGFNIAYALLLRGSELRLRRRTVRLKRGILRQTERLARGEALGKRAFGRLRRKLRRVRNLIALDRALSALPSQDAPLLGQYMGRMQPTLLYLARVYRRREPTQAAYFAFFTARWVRAGQGEGQALEALEQALLGLSGRRPSIDRRAVGGTVRLWPAHPIGHPQLHSLLQRRLLPEDVRPHGGRGGG